MKKEVYDEIFKFQENFFGNDAECIAQLSLKYPDISTNALYSIKSLVEQRQCMKNLKKTKASILDIYNRFQGELKLNRSSNLIIPKIAREYNIPPTQMARLIIEQELSLNPSAKIEHSTSQVLMDSTKISHNGLLAKDIFLTTLFNTTNGPMADVIKNLTGKQYEKNLEKLLEENGLIFKNESELRCLGYDKTPDILLEIPVAISGFVVNWIESKALFADEKNHRQYTVDQYDSYFNRFGSGLVIYWFGYLDSLDQGSMKFIIRENLPVAEIIKMDSELSGNTNLID